MINGNSDFIFPQEIERSGSGMKTTIDVTTSEGKPSHTETEWTFDGKDHPVKGASAPNATAAYKRIDDRTFEVTSKVDGKPTTTTRVAISPDGKTMTATQRGKNAQGESVAPLVGLGVGRVVRQEPGRGSAPLIVRHDDGGSRYGGVAGSIGDGGFDGVRTTVAVRAAARGLELHLPRPGQRRR
jgi:hypothetical protein